ncbi:MAG: FAD-dependent oxidoreductase, partial [Candidatus Aenigmarchaeota archaeon]|nr:FAD-dependent oxidoreductase [Candidatus Aenigmarchaeota archaeon]
MKMECDVLVIGAGVSGCVSALNLTKQRINTIVLEKEKEVGLHTKNKIDITEDSGIMPIINELNIPIMQRINKTKWFSRNYSFNLKSKTYDLYFKRGSSSDCFEKQMSKKIIKNKGIFYTDVKKIKFVYKKNIVEIVKVYYKNKSIIIRPKIIIGADGKNSVVLNSTALKKEK